MLGTKAKNVQHTWSSAETVYVSWVGAALAVLIPATLFLQGVLLAVVHLTSLHWWQEAGFVPLKSWRILFPYLPMIMVALLATSPKTKYGLTATITLPGCITAQMAIAPQRLIFYLLN